MALRRLRNLLLFSLGALSLPLVASAAEKLDFSPYLASASLPGDFRIFARSTGGTRTETMLDVEPWRSGVREVIESVTSGAGPSFDGTSLFEGFILPGKQLLTGNEILDGQVLLFAKKPSKDLRLMGTLGKPQRIKKKADVISSSGVDVGDIQLLGAWVAEGFPGASTPSGAYPDALRAFSITGIRITSGPFTQYLYAERTHWYAAGIGLVQLTTHLEVFENGAFVESHDWTEELSAGKVLGIAFP